MESKYACLITNDNLAALVMLEKITKNILAKKMIFEITEEEKYYSEQKIWATVYREK